MPQLPQNRNPMVLLGSYLSNLTLNLQRVLPVMQRTSDLLQRESLIQDPSQRAQVSQMTQQVGKALREIAIASGSTAHLFENLEVGPAVGQVRI